MLIIALALAVIGLAALVFAVVTSNALVAWVCIGASALGVILLTVDALRDRNRQRPASAEPAATGPSDAAEPTPEPAEVSESVDIDESQQPADAEHPGEAEPAGEEPGTESAEPDQNTD